MKALTYFTDGGMKTYTEMKRDTAQFLPTIPPKKTFLELEDGTRALLVQTSNLVSTIQRHLANPFYFTNTTTKPILPAPEDGMLVEILKS